MGGLPKLRMFMVDCLPCSEGLGAMRGLNIDLVNGLFYSLLSAIFSPRIWLTFVVNAKFTSNHKEESLEIFLKTFSQFCFVWIRTLDLRIVSRVFYLGNGSIRFDLN